MKYKKIICRPLRFIPFAPIFFAYFFYAIFSVFSFGLPVDNFETGTLTNPINKNDWKQSDRAVMSLSTIDSIGQYSLRVSGSAVNYYVGYVSSYQGSVNGYGNVPPDWNFRYVNVMVNNRGRSGDKVKIELFDNNADTWEVQIGTTTSKFYYEFPMLWTNQWKMISIPMSLFAYDRIAGGGDGILHLNHRTVLVPDGWGGTYPLYYPGILMIGFAINSLQATGIIQTDLDNLEVSDSTGFADSDIDGLPDSWEITYFGNLAQYNGADDPDMDGLTNLQEYINGTNPLVKNMFPMIDDFANNGIINSSGLAWSVGDGINRSFSTIVTHCMVMSGPATGYYSGSVGAYIGDSTADWGQYSSIKLMLWNGGQAGDRITIQLTDNDTNDYAGDSGDDVWEFTQVVNNSGEWNYYTIPFSQFKLVTVSGGDKVLNLSPSGGYPGVVYINFVNLSATPTGNTRIAIANLEVSTENTSLDSDGDGLPNNWEIFFGLDPNSILGDNGWDGNPDHDGYLNIREYLYGLNPVERNPYFPVIDDFEDGNFIANPVWIPTASVVMAMITSANGAIGNYSVRISASTTNYYAGIATTYIGSPQLDWSQYGYVKLMINNRGHKNDILRVSVYQNEAAKWGVSINETDSLFEHNIPVVETNNWNEYIIPYLTFIHVNSLIGSDTLTGRIISRNGVLYPGVLMVALSLIHSNSSNVNMSMDVDILMVTGSMNIASAGDGLPYAWKRAMGLDANDISGINAAGADPDGDGYINLEEYQNKTNPLLFDFNPITMDLKAGFNLISLPTSPDLTAAQLIAAVNAQGGSVAAVYGWDIINSQWSQLSTQKIFYGHAYLLACNTDSLFLPPGVAVPLAQSVSIMGSSYNFFGVNVGGPYTAKTLLDDINAQGGNATTVYALTSGGWTSWKPSFIGIDPFRISRLKGFVVYSTGNSTWKAH